MENKPGWKSSEFWLNISGISMTAFAFCQGMIPPATCAAIIGGIITVYTVARTIAKATTSKKDDEFLDKMAAILKGKGGIDVTPKP